MYRLFIVQITCLMLSLEAKQSCDCLQNFHVRIETQPLCFRVGKISMRSLKLKQYWFMMSRFPCLHWISYSCLCWQDIHEICWRKIYDFVSKRSMESINKQSMSSIDKRSMSSISKRSISSVGKRSMSSVARIDNVLGGYTFILFIRSVSVLLLSDAIAVDYAWLPGCVTRGTSACTCVRSSVFFLQTLQ